MIALRAYVVAVMDSAGPADINRRKLLAMYSVLNRSIDAIGQRENQSEYAKKRKAHQNLKYLAGDQRYRDLRVQSLIEERDLLGDELFFGGPIS